MSNIGDAVLTLPVIGALQENFRYATVDVVAGPKAKEIFEADPRIGRTYVYDKAAPPLSKIRLLWQLRRNRYDLLIDLRNSLFGFFVGARFCSRPARKRPGTVQHKIDEHLERVKELGITVEAKAYPVWITKSDTEKADRLLNKKGIRESEQIICLSPGAKSHIKRWTESGFAKAGDALAEAYKCKVVLAGDTSDIPICDRILNRMRSFAVSVAGQTNLRELSAIIKRAELLITNDSAPLHIAGSLGTPVVAIFGPTDRKKYGPRGGAGVALYKKLHCSPCETALCRYNLECMKAVTAEEVIEAGKGLLDGRTEKKI